jgi:signal transduction histidine kinase/DNA-binding response OmpR family regulator
MEKVIAVLIFAFGIALMIKKLEDEKTTAEKSKLQLVAETSKMKELDAFKTRFYTNMTHEFRTPLTIILGMVEQIRQKPGEWYEKGLDMIQRNGNKLLKLTNQMLYLSKLEARVLPVHKIRGNICLYLNYLVESFHSMAASKQIVLSLHCPDHPIVMDYDPDKIQEIVSNLLSNAIKFTPENGSVEIRVNQVSIDGADMLQLVVSDSGQGIAPEILPHVFDRYFTVDSPSGPNAEGTGLGLSLTKEVVRLLNGTIQAESGVGEGSTFTVHLPITRQAEEKDWQEVYFTDDQRRSNKRFATETPAMYPGAETVKNELLVLLVEDNLDVIDYLSSLLKDHYRIETAANGKIGWEKSLEMMPDLVVSDVMMPVMDGFELCAKLKNDIRTSHIPIILLTAKADAESKLEGLETGADAYLAKPFNQQELFIRIQKLIELRQNMQKRYEKMALEQRKPDESQTLSREDTFILKVQESIEKHLNNVDFGIDVLCRDLAMSRSALYRKFNALTDTTIHQFVLSVRLARARELLLHSSLNISQIALEAGFKNTSHFSRAYSKTYGEPPSKTRK